MFCNTHTDTHKIVHGLNVGNIETGITIFSTSKQCSCVHDLDAIVMRTQSKGVFPFGVRCPEFGDEVCTVVSGVVRNDSRQL